MTLLKLFPLTVTGPVRPLVTMRIGRSRSALRGSDFLKADRERPIRIVTKGLTGPVTVNGNSFNNVMPPQVLTDQQIADVLTYVTNDWGNGGEPYTVDDVRRVKASGVSQ